MQDPRVIVKPIPRAPADFDGSLQELFEEWAQHVLLDPRGVEQFHLRLCEYLMSEDPLYLVRMVKGLTRGKDVRNISGARLRPTDNAPAWWIHYQLFSGKINSSSDFATWIESVPWHMFRVGLAESISTAGWHVAHIYNVKDGDTNYQFWSRTDLARRMARNIHPCNYFYIPKCDWQRFGGHPVVVAFFYDQFRQRYTSIWDDFRSLVDGQPLPVTGREGQFRYQYTCSSSQGTREDPSRSPGPKTDNCTARYSYSRLCFKADIIEALEMDDVFCVDTPEGTFQMTRREFYAFFPNVIKSASYLKKGIYHFPKPPQKALRFKTS